MQTLDHRGQTLSELCLEAWLFITISCLKPCTTSYGDLAPPEYTCSLFSFNQIPKRT
jgi:hypothetical protein